MSCKTHRHIVSTMACKTHRHIIVQSDSTDSGAGHHSTEVLVLCPVRHIDTSLVLWPVRHIDTSQYSQIVLTVGQEITWLRC